jgi:hypothetical protein
MPTVKEILKQTGLTDDQITALDAKVVNAFGGVLTTAEQEHAAAQQAAAKAEQERAAAQTAAEKAEQDRVAALAAQEAAEVAKRANAEFYDQSIAPALNNWGTEKSNLEAQVAYYKAQNEGARAAGFIPAEAPGFQAPAAAPGNGQGRDAQGRYVPNAPGGTPGSPTFTMEDVKKGLGSVLGTVTDIQWKYQSLYGKPMPISPTELIRQAESVKLDPAAYAARNFKFAEKEAEMARAAAEEHDAKIKTETAAAYEAKLVEAEKAKEEAVKATDRKWAEKIGSNPDVRIAQPSRFADVARAVRANERPDPLSLNEQQRRQATSQAIRQEISEQSNAA